MAGRPGAGLSPRESRRPEPPEEAQELSWGTTKTTPGRPLEHAALPVERGLRGEHPLAVRGPAAVVIARDDDSVQHEGVVEAIVEALPHLNHCATRLWVELGLEN